MQEYIVKVWNDRTEWRQNNQLHRIDGPAVEYADVKILWLIDFKYQYRNGDKEWWIDGLEYTQDEFNQKMKKNCIENKVVEIEGKKYKLVLI